MPKKNDVWIIGAVLAVALVLFITWNAFRDRSRRLDTLVPQETQAPQIDETVGADNHAQATEAEADGSAAGEPVFFGPALPENDEPVAGYVLITVNGKQYGDPIAMDREKTITIKQDDEHINQVHITRQSVEMHSSSCENQDCVLQGVITPENYKTRILSSFIVCLPNEVSIEFVPAQNIQED